MTFRSISGFCAALMLSIALAGCSKSPTGPTPQPPPAVPAPIIGNVSVAATRAEAGQDVAVTATVEDGAPTASALTYQWTANVGTVTGTGASAVWRLNKGVISSGADVVITLTVVKPYQALENGQLVSREHRISKAATAFRAHDSNAEVSRIVLTFLVDYFGKYEVSPDACLVDFSSSCPGTAEERDNIIDNRKRTNLRIVSTEARIGSIEFNGDRTFAWVVAPCKFTDVVVATGRQEWSSGNCELTAIYQQNRWWICNSNYRANNGGSSPSRVSSPLSRGLRYWD